MRSASRIVILLVFLLVGANLLKNVWPEAPGGSASRDLGIVDWTAIAAWPPLDDAIEVESVPDPDQTVTIIVLDDSGSMSRDFRQAKAAVLQSVEMMDANDRVGVLALNAGLILPVAPAREASAALPGRLQPVSADGTTPLGPALSLARDMLSAEATRSRAFGTYRIIVTTDGQADVPERLTAEVARTVNSTPIELATIGIGIGQDHVLNAKGQTSYVAVDDVSALGKALQAAIAENARFDPIKSFE